MSNLEIDRLQAAAEARLDRVDDGEIVPADDGHIGGSRGAVDLGDGMHVEEAGEPYDGDDSEEEDGHLTAEASEALDALVEAFNARDLDAIADLCCEDCETPGLAFDMDDLEESLGDLWNRRPTITMTREVVDDQAVGILWERGETAGWAAVGTVHVDMDGDGLIGVIEFSDDAGLLDEIVAEPPDGDLEEGVRWEEWDEGAE